jgi:hypothetical protein
MENNIILYRNKKYYNIISNEKYYNIIRNEDYNIISNEIDNDNE